MARAHGARAQMALAFETVYGTPPASGYRLMPFARTTLGAEQPLLNSELLGYGRDPLAPIKDAVTADGDVVVPIDVEAFGFWLKAAFGAPTTTGTTPKTHTFQSGNWTLPSMAIEVSMPEVPRFAMYAGCVMDQLSWQMNRSGLLTATAKLIAQGEAISATTAAGNLAQSLGTTTRSIQVLAFAGDLAGVSMEEIAAASKKLTLKLSDAAGGTGTAVEALQRLHLTATDLQALPLDERIAAIQDAMAQFVPPAERAAVASGLFGDKAALAFSRIDSATLRQASQDVTDFGVAVSDQDADQIRTAGDAVDRLGLVWLGLTNQLTVAVAPALEMVANALADATRKGGAFQTSIAFLGDHIGEIASIAGVFAAFFGSRFVVALGAAALGVSGFSLSLTALKGALIRTGIVTGGLLILFIAARPTAVPSKSVWLTRLPAQPSSRRSLLTFRQQRSSCRRASF